MFPLKEAFIPYSRQEVIELCLADGKIAIAEQQEFRDFCQILAAYYHFKLHSCLEDLKSNFVPFNPDLIEERVRGLSYSAEELQKKEDDLIATFESILKQANYYRISKQELAKALLEDSLFDLKTEVDFDDFDRMVCYCRGESTDTVTQKKWLFKTVERQVDVYRRVVLLIKF